MQGTPEIDEKYKHSQGEIKHSEFSQQSKDKEQPPTKNESGATFKEKSGYGKAVSHKNHDADGKSQTTEEGEEDTIVDLGN